MSGNRNMARRMILRDQGIGFHDTHYMRGSGRRRGGRRRRPGQYRHKYSHPYTKIIKGPNITPDRIMVKLKYTETTALTGAALFDYKYRGNSIFDPEEGVGGGQPTGFDQWANFYNQYIVTASAIRVDIVNTLASGSTSFIVVPTSESTSLATNLDLVQNYPYAKSALLGPLSSSRSTRRIKHYISTAKMYGKNPRAIMDDDQFGAITTANPVEQWHWHILAQSIDGTTNITGTLQVEITFYVVFYDRRDLTAS